MSNDAAVTKDLIQMVEDGPGRVRQRSGEAGEDGETALAATFRDLGEKRGQMAVKDAIAGSDPDGVPDAAEQGEDHTERAAFTWTAATRRPWSTRSTS